MNNKHLKCESRVILTPSSSCCIVFLTQISLWLSSQIDRIVKKLTAIPKSVEVNITPNLVDFLATECREILDILLDIVVFPSSRYFDTKNKVHNCNQINL
jgi:hypothetical protein